MPKSSVLTRCCIGIVLAAVMLVNVYRHSHSFQHDWRSWYSSMDLNPSAIAAPTAAPRMVRESSSARPTNKTGPNATTVTPGSMGAAAARGNTISVHTETKTEKKIQTDDAEVTAANKAQSSEQKQTFHSLLKPTFQGLHNFAMDGPRKQPFLHGLSSQELLNFSSAATPTTIIPTTTDGPVEVSFYAAKDAHYSAAWLSSLETFLTNPTLDLKKSIKDHQNPNLEYGTFAGLKGRTCHLTINMLDFFVHHLSRYKGRHSVSGPDQTVNWNKYLAGLDAMQHTYEELSFNNPNLDRNGRVLVVCPFHGASDNHSGQDEKQLHLNVTVKALARVFPSIIITVCDEANLKYVSEDSGLNEYLYDVLLVKNQTMGPITKCTHLPYLSNVQVRRELELNQSQGRYSMDDFDWIYYTESDEPPLLTNLNALLTKAAAAAAAIVRHKNDRPNVVVPHRSYPVAMPRDLNISLASKSAKEFMALNRHKVVHQVHDLRDHACCFPPQNNNAHNNKDYKPQNKTEWQSPEIQLFRQYTGHAQANGECNPFRLTCIVCKFRNRTDGPCPTTI